MSGLIEELVTLENTAESDDAINAIVLDFNTRMLTNLSVSPWIDDFGTWNWVIRDDDKEKILKVGDVVILKAHPMQQFSLSINDSFTFGEEEMNTAQKRINNYREKMTPERPTKSLYEKWQNRVIKVRELFDELSADPTLKLTDDFGFIMSQFEWGLIFSLLEAKRYSLLEMKLNAAKRLNRDLAKLRFDFLDCELPD